LGIQNGDIEALRKISAYELVKAKFSEKIISIVVKIINTIRIEIYVQKAFKEILLPLF